jgi:serine/threonine-protein kinase
VNGFASSPARAAQISAIVDAVIDDPPDARTARLDALCNSDAALRAIVDAILAQDVADETPFRSAVADALSAAAHAAAADETGRRLGPYRLIREIGRGGMGAVYLAARDDREFEQQAAIKIVRGILAPGRLQRFRAERQILASLVHPNVARLLDGGTTDDGVPYFVMEFVDGAPIDVFSRDRHLAVRERLTLFLQVCDAVSYAHRRLIVHRDLKPTNILVTADGTPKLLDFGIAKLIADEEESPTAALTIEPLLTPEYASPEQARGNVVTTATDVYSLGVLLFELLTGERPYRFASKRADEVTRVICEQQPPRPSSLAHGRALKGDLDTIVLTALEKEPTRRYASADALGDDIRRHLAGEPVLVRPATFAYRASRFARRHRRAVAAAAAGVLLLTGWGVTASIQARRVARERDAARQVTAFLVDLFASTDPAETRSKDVTAREILDRGVERLNDLDDRPDIKAQLLDAIGKVYRSLGARERATTLLTDALQLHERLDGRDAPQTTDTINELAETMREAGRLDTAEPLYREALTARERRFGRRSLEVAQSLNNLALLMHARGHDKEAQPLFEEAVSIQREKLGPNNPKVAVTLGNLSLVARDQARYADAERLARQTLSIRLATLGDVHPYTANAYMALGQVLNMAGRSAEAVEPMTHAIELQRRIYGDDHPIVDSSLNNLASLRQDLGDLEAAEPLYREALTHQRRRLGRASEVAITANNLASLLEERRRFDEAEALYRDSLDIRRERLGPKHQSVARAEHNLARLLTEEHRFADAEPLAASALALRRERLGEQHPETAQSLALLGTIRVGRGDAAAGEAMLRTALTTHRTALGPGHPTTIATGYALGLVLLNAGRRAEAEPLLRAAAEFRAKRLPPTHWLRLETEDALRRATR